MKEINNRLCYRNSKLDNVTGGMSWTSVWFFSLIYPGTSQPIPTRIKIDIHEIIDLDDIYHACLISKWTSAGWVTIDSPTFLDLAEIETEMLCLKMVSSFLTGVQMSNISLSEEEIEVTLPPKRVESGEKPELRIVKEKDDDVLDYE